MWTGYLVYTVNLAVGPFFILVLNLQSLLHMCVLLGSCWLLEVVVQASKRGLVKGEVRAMDTGEVFGNKSVCDSAQGEIPFSV